MRTLLHAVRSSRRTALSAVAALGLTLGGLISLSTAPAAHADTQICDQYGSTTIQGRYVVQNNRWGTTATQCINVTGNGFQITQADGTATNGGPKSYPSVFYGCHYTNCSPGTNLPAQLSAISSAPTGVSFSYVGNAVYDAAYDIWLDPTPRKDGVNKTEIMVWYNHTNPVQPVGSRVGTANVAGRSWDVWTGNNGSNDVISFVAPSAIGSWNFDVKAFTDETVRRGWPSRPSRPPRTSEAAATPAARREAPPVARPPGAPPRAGRPREAAAAVGRREAPALRPARSPSPRRPGPAATPPTSRWPTPVPPLSTDGESASPFRPARRSRAPGTPRSARPPAP
jgi:hypothetical protein